MCSKKFHITFVIAFVMMVTLSVLGCFKVATQNRQVCNDIHKGGYSIICQISDQFQTTPESVAAVLKVANISGLAADTYTAQQAKDFINQCRQYLVAAKENGVTYAVAYAALIEKYKMLPPKIKAIFVAARDSIGVDLAAAESADRLLSDFDYYLLLKHLEDQDKIVAPGAVTAD